MASNGQKASERKIPIKMDLASAPPPSVSGPKYFKTEQNIAFWGRLRDMQLGTMRDGVSVSDIGLRTMGVLRRKDTNQIWLQFQFIDPQRTDADPTSSHTYSVTGEITLFDEVPDDFP